jgi:Na+/H+ antiporter NhaA
VGRWVADWRLHAILVDRLHPCGNEPTGETVGRPDLVRESLSPLERPELALDPWVGLVAMPLFALADAGLAVAAGDAFAPVASAT